jgi:hypothetical protein
VPRDRNGTFEPTLVKKGVRQLDGFDDRIISLYARGMTTRDIRAHVEEVYGVDVSPAFISRVTNAVMEEVRSRAGALKPNCRHPDNRRPAARAWGGARSSGKLDGSMEDALPLRSARILSITAGGATLALRSKQ